MGKGAEERPLPDPRVLGWLLATHTVLQALPTGRKLGEFLAGALRDIPGISAGGLCLSDFAPEICDGSCQALQGGCAGDPASGCACPGKDCFPLQTSHGVYGRLILEITDRNLFAPYKPFLGNFVGSLALLLETRYQRVQLEETLEKLSEGEKRYRQLFARMTAGHAVHEIILDEAGVPWDYRFIEVNPAFEEITGLSRDMVVGRTAREVLPGLEPVWVARYGRVALTGDPVHFEDYNQDLDRYYDVVAYRPQPGQFAVVFTDVTQRIRMQERLREASEELAALNEGLKAQNEELQLAQEEAARLLEEQRGLFSQLQEALLDIPKQLPGVRFGHLYRSATKEARIGGDFYDVFRVRDDLIALLIGDVSGHGIEAARVAMLVRDTVHAFAHQCDSPRVVLREVNQLIVEENLPGFITGFLGFLDPEGGTLVYSSAGHPPPLLVTDGHVMFLECGSSPLGAFADTRYQDYKAAMREGSLLLLYTDGITEVRGDGELFGEERLVAAFRRARDQGAEEFPSLILSEALLFSGGKLEDDAALLAVNYLGKPGWHSGSRGAW